MRPLATHAGAALLAFAAGFGAGHAGGDGTPPPFVEATPTPILVESTPRPCPAGGPDTDNDGELDGCDGDDDNDGLGDAVDPNRLEVNR